MISFRSKNDQMYAFILIVGLLLLFGTGCWMTFFRLPNEADNKAAQTNRDIKKFDADIDATEKTNAVAQAAIAGTLWTVGPDEVSPQALSIVSGLAAKNHLKVIAFRPQKPVDVQGMTSIPFSLSVDGAYLDALKLVKDIETTDTKLAVSLVQVNSAEASSDHVTGTINFVAYLKAAPIKPAATPKGTPAATPIGKQSAQKS